MLGNETVLYSAFKSKDPKYDGKFYIGISSTKIYCRPVCKAKLPKPENCNFFLTAAEAEQAGFRPCLICRPELAPGTASMDATANLAYRAAKILEENCGEEQNLEKVANRLGYSDRHLRRAFIEQYKVAPIEYLQTCRLLLAKNLLTDTDLSVVEVAMIAGFGSLRRFNDLFKTQYNLVPTELRKQAKENKQSNGKITLELGYRPPYEWQKMLDFFCGRAICGVELIENGQYIRTVQIKNAKGETITGWLKVGHEPSKNALKVTVSVTLLSALPQVLARVRRLFDLYCDPDSIYEMLSAMNKIKPNLCVLGTRVPGCFNNFEMAVRAVLGQQITVKAATTLAKRIVQTYGIPIETGIDGLTHIFPTPEDFLAMGDKIQNNLGKLGITSTRSHTIQELARKIVNKEIDFDSIRPEQEMTKLMAIKGIGNWTANYIAMRAMEYSDAFLETDVGVKNALPSYTPKELLELAEAWRPYRSYAVFNLWNTLY